MPKNNNLTDFLTDVADAIRAKKGTTAKINPQDFSSEIASIPVGGGSTTTSKSSVNFYDYDGTLLHSYSKGEFLALSALPDLPTREGLTCQGWNYTLTKAKEYVTSYDILNIGATYITDDGKTRLYIRIAANGRMTVPLYFSQTATNGVNIDWGDGSATQTLAGTGNVNTTHTYASIGDYIITLKVTSGTLGLGNGSSQYSVMGSTDNNGRVYCNMLQRVEIGSSVTSIGTYAFYFCYSIASVVIPSSVTSIENNAFYYCYSLSSIVIPNSVTNIGNNAFYNCYSLASINIPEGVTNIGNNAFINCYSLSSIVIPNSVMNIGSKAFNGCYSIASINIPEGVTSIGNNAFTNCYSLSSINITEGVTSIGSSTFNGCYSLASVVIPSSVTSIGSNVFQNCYSLSSINIPEGITNIRNYTFYNCYSLSSINIPEGVTNIESNAFYNCYSLASINIPEGVTKIGNNAFYNCYGMAYYDFRASKSVPTLSSTNAFNSIPPDCKVVVPDSLYSSWTTATNWSTYANQIVKASNFNG